MFSALNLLSGAKSIYDDAQDLQDKKENFETF